MNWRGEYEGGGMVVTAKHWWSPKERKSARLAAKVLEDKAPEFQAKMQERWRRAVLYGESYSKPTWKP